MANRIIVSLKKDEEKENGGKMGRKWGVIMSILSVDDHKEEEEKKEGIISIRGIEHQFYFHKNNVLFTAAIIQRKRE